MLLVVIILPSASYGEIDPGCHEITPEEKEGLKAAGVTIPAGGQFCDRDKPLIYGGCTENPFLYLQQINRSGYPTDVSGLNPIFACRLYGLTKLAAAEGKNITIVSGYRSVERQKQMYATYVAAGRTGAPVAPPGQSKHNYGLAADLHYEGKLKGSGVGSQATADCIAQISSCAWAHRNYSGFGLRYPMVVEPWHIEPSGTIGGMQPPVPPNGIWVSDETGTAYSAVGNNVMGGNPFGNPYNPTQQNQMCMVSTAPMMLMPCGQSMPYMSQPMFSPTPFMPPPPPMPPMQAFNPMTTNQGYTTGGTPMQTQPTTQPPAVSVTPIYSTSTRSIPAASLIIAQTRSIPRNGSTVIAWTSVGMIPTSCTITQNDIPFGVGSEGSSVLSVPHTSQSGTTTIKFDCTDFGGVLNRRVVDIVVQ